MTRSETFKRNAVLTMNTVGFTVMFAVWVVFAIVGIPIRKELGLSETEFALLVALPVLTGSLLRLPIGMATDRWGGRPIFTGLLVFTAIPLFGLVFADQYWQYLALGLLIGMAGTSFAVGIAYTSSWFPKHLQGTALGIFGAGNTGASLTKLLAPPLITVVPAGGLGLIPGGWRFIPFLYAIALLVTAAVYWSCTYSDVSHQKQSSMREMLRPLKDSRVWRFSLYYFLVFGGYVALSLWLPKYYIDVYGLDLKTAALLTAIFVFPSGIIRAPGGWLSDKFGARAVMTWVLTTCLVTSFALMLPDGEMTASVPAKYGGEVTLFSFHMTVTGFTILVFLLGIAMGIGKAAVYKHIPDYFPTQVGVVGGIVGVIGGLGGFIMPILFGALVQWTHLPTTTFFFIFAVTGVSFAWMLMTVQKVMAEAAPQASQEIEECPAEAGPGCGWRNSAPVTKVLVPAGCCERPVLQRMHESPLVGRPPET
jgi:NNP family nitrate/nitrite transporter-like MFS transporter